MGFRQDLYANTEFSHSAFSRAASAVRPFEVRQGMEGEATPETDLIRCHQDLEEGDRFESSYLRLGVFITRARIALQYMSPPGPNGCSFIWAMYNGMFGAKNIKK